MKATYCKRNRYFTIKISKDEFNNLSDEFDNEDWDMIGNIIDKCDSAINTTDDVQSRYRVSSLDPVIQNQLRGMTNTYYEREI